MKKKGKEKGAGEGQGNGKRGRGRGRGAVGSPSGFRQDFDMLPTSASNFTGH